MTAPPSSMDEVVGELQRYLPMNAEQTLMSRRKFFKRTAIGGASATLILTGGSTLKQYMDSSLLARQELLDEHRRTGRVNLDTLEHLLQKILEEKMVPPLLRAGRAVESSLLSSSLSSEDEKRKNMNSHPSSMLDKRYEISTIPMLDMTFFPRGLFLAWNRLKEEKLREYYLLSIRTRDYSEIKAFGIFTTLDPLEEFSLNIANVQPDADFSAQALKLLADCKAAVAGEHFVANGELSYLITSTKQKIKQPYHHLLRAQSYYIAKHLANFPPAHEMCRAHLKTLENMLIEDGLVRDRVFFNDSAQFENDDHERFGKPLAERLEGKFYAFALNQVLMIDLFQDALSYFPEEKTFERTFELLSKRYQENILQTGSNGRRNATLPSPEFLFAPPPFNTTNNLPLAFYADTVMRRLSRGKAASNFEDSLIMALVSLMEFEFTPFPFENKEGIIPSSRFETDRYSLEYLFATAFYACNAIDQYIRKKKK